MQDSQQSAVAEFEGATDTRSPIHGHNAPPARRAATGPDTVRAADGFPIATTRLQAHGNPAGVVIVAGAIGVPQRFYRRFTRFAQRRGYDTVTFDYRGIARSAPATLRGFRMDLRDWGRLDLAAVIDDAAARAAETHTPVYLVGHSFGGHALAMTPNHSRVHAGFIYGMGAGWHGWMTARERLKVQLLWGVVGPLLTRAHGYLPWSRIGMGEDLPIDAYRQWRQWCRYPHFCLDDPALGAELRAQFAQVATPLCVASSTDDAWSPPRSRNAILTGFTNAPLTRLDLDASALPVKALGHMGFFRTTAESLWPAVFQWFRDAATQ